MVGHNASACVYPKEAVTSLVYVLMSSRDYSMYIYVAVTCKLQMWMIMMVGLADVFRDRIFDLV